MPELKEKIEYLESLINEWFEKRAEITPDNADSSLVQTVEEVLRLLGIGELRVAEPDGEGGWKTNEWLKKAILLNFAINNDIMIANGQFNYYDRVLPKFAAWQTSSFVRAGIRVVPPATVRRGAFVGRGSVLMPSFVNIGAHVGEKSMIDTWATVGSCAQVGANVHISGGAGIGGVLEPLQESPTIIEDDCFIGARSEVVEGVIVGKGSVLGMGVFLGKSTKILNRSTGEVTYGKVPPGSVVVPGAIPAEDKSHSLACAVIVKQVDEQTRAKTSINELLRSY
ncbi:MAG: 2,3,4,5-tetrahydropyridine-2,6-dicarboxylate N-succinyltransferase [Betaproteobacteria bacterium]|nr:2,3,4,5-tetrahydropyridine-2,6-dicarboxylate N-succinyltransferase [Betaproteobacteria bacterium]